MRLRVGLSRATAQARPFDFEATHANSCFWFSCAKHGSPTVLKLSFVPYYEGVSMYFFTASAKKAGIRIGLYPSSRSTTVADPSTATCRLLETAETITAHVRMTVIHICLMRSLKTIANHRGFLAPVFESSR
jgi:hypothetical protein